MFQVWDWWRVRGTLSLLHLFCSVNCRWIGVKSVWDFLGIRMVGLRHLENRTRFAMRSRSPVWVHLWLNQCEGILDMQWWTSSPVHPIEIRIAAQRCLCIGSQSCFSVQTSCDSSVFELCPMVWFIALWEQTWPYSTLPSHLSCRLALMSSPLAHRFLCGNVSNPKNDLISAFAICMSKCKI